MSTNENKISPDDPRLTAFALGELKGEELAQMEAELRADPAAQAIVAQIRVAADQFQAALAGETVEAAASGEGGVQRGRGSRSIFRRFMFWGIPLAACLAVLLVHENLQRRANEPEEAVTLSPFEVNAAKAQGYFTPNTAVTRLSNNIGDIPSSVTVVDKQQLANTNAQNINNITMYEAGTQGSHTYTPKTGSTESTRNYDALALDQGRMEASAVAKVSGGFGGRGTQGVSGALSTSTGTYDKAAVKDLGNIAVPVSDDAAWILNQIDRGVSFDQLTTAPNTFPTDLTAP
jgi:hypothetical protein